MQEFEGRGRQLNMKALESRCVQIKVRQFKKIGEGRRNTMGWSGDKNDRQLIYWKSKIYHGIKMTISLELIDLESGLKNKNEYQEDILMRCVTVVEVEMTL